MLGTIVNTAAIVAGSLWAAPCGGALRKNTSRRSTPPWASPPCFWAPRRWWKTSPSRFPVLFIASLAVGSLIGTALDIDGAFTRLVRRFSKTELSQGLSTGILLCCMGSLSILGPIQSALLGDHTFLFTNATLDFVTFMVLGSAYGPGMCAAGAVLFCWQGSIYLGASALEGFFTGDVMRELSIVGACSSPRRAFPS